MNFIIKHDELSIRYLQEGDELFLLKWLTDQQVLAYYEGRDRPYTREKVLEDFSRKNLDNQVIHDMRVLYKNGLRYLIGLVPNHSLVVFWCG